VFIDNDIGDIKHIFTPTENALYKAFKRGREQGASTILVEIVTPDLSRETIEKIAKHQLGKRIKKIIVSWNGEIIDIP
jgi:hypothetical protein